MRFNADTQPQNRSPAAALLLLSEHKRWQMQLQAHSAGRRALQAPAAAHARRRPRSTAGTGPQAPARRRRPADALRSASQAPARRCRPQRHGFRPGAEE